MKITYKLFTALAAICFLLGCSVKEPPRDSSGKTPQQVLMDTYVLILEGKYEDAKNNFSPEFIEEFVTKKNITFVEYCGNTKGWKSEWLKTKLVGNDYNDELWRVKIIPDEGKGSENSPGIVQDLYIIDSVWKIAFWNHYPKS